MVARQAPEHGKLNIVHCALNIVGWSLNIVHCTMYTLHIQLYTVRLTQYGVNFPFYTECFKLYRAGHAVLCYLWPWAPHPTLTVKTWRRKNICFTVYHSKRWNIEIYLFQYYLQARGIFHRSSLGLCPPETLQLKGYIWPYIPPLILIRIHS